MSCWVLSTCHNHWLKFITALARPILGLRTKERSLPVDRVGLAGQKLASPSCPGQRPGMNLFTHAWEFSSWAESLENVQRRSLPRTLTSPTNGCRPTFLNLFVISSTEHFCNGLQSLHIPANAGLRETSKHTDWLIKMAYTNMPQREYRKYPTTPTFLGMSAYRLYRTKLQMLIRTRTRTSGRAILFAFPHEYTSLLPTIGCSTNNRNDTSDTQPKVAHRSSNVFISENFHTWAIWLCCTRRARTRRGPALATTTDYSKGKAHVHSTHRSSLVEVSQRCHRSHTHIYTFSACVLLGSGCVFCLCRLYCYCGNRDEGWTMHFETTQYRTGDLQDVICFLDDLLVVFRKLPPVTTSMVLRSMGWEEKEGDRVRKGTRSSLHRPKRSSSRQYYPPLPVTVRTKLSTYTTLNNSELHSSIPLLNHTLSCSKCPLLLLFMLLFSWCGDINRAEVLASEMVLPR